MTDLKIQPKQDNITHYWWDYSSILLWWIALGQHGVRGDYMIDSQIDRPVWSYPCSLSLF